MKISLTKVIFILGAIALICGAYYLYTIEYTEMSIISFIVGGVILIFSIITIVNDIILNKKKIVTDDEII